MRALCVNLVEDAKSVCRQGNRPRTTPEDNALARRFEWRVGLSRLALIGERIWEALLWPFLVRRGLSHCFAVRSVERLPPLLHRGLLVAFGIALLVSLLPLIRFAMPTRAEALRRLERNAEIKHRPASSYEDRLGTTPRGDTALLWAAHRERLGQLVAKLKPSWPAPRTDRKDPYALRAALLLVLVVAALAAGPDRWGRIAPAFTPAANTATALAPPRCLGHAAGLYRHRAHRACRRQRAGRRRRREPSARCRCLSGAS